MKLHSVFDEPHKTCLVLELILGGNMQHRMGVNGCAFSEATASQILGDILSALRCIHRSVEQAQRRRGRVAQKRASSTSLEAICGAPAPPAPCVP